jgi:hypothetical protein
MVITLKVRLSKNIINNNKSRIARLSDKSTGIKFLFLKYTFVPGNIWEIILLIYFLSYIWNLNFTGYPALCLENLLRQTYHDITSSLLAFLTVTSLFSVLFCTMYWCLNVEFGSACFGLSWFWGFLNYFFLKHSKSRPSTPPTNVMSSPIAVFFFFSFFYGSLIFNLAIQEPNQGNLGRGLRFQFTSEDTSW